MYKVKRELLEDYVQKYPEWASVLNRVIEENLYVVLPWDYLRIWPIGKASWIGIYEPDLKGSPSFFAIEGDMVTCTNYNSPIPQTIDQFIEYIRQKVENQPLNDQVLENLLTKKE